MFALVWCLIACSLSLFVLLFYVMILLVTDLKLLAALFCEFRFGVFFDGFAYSG